MKLDGRILERTQLTGEEINSMFSLMNEFYDNMNMDVFLRDLANKDYCLLLCNEEKEVVGFTTQKIMSFEMDGKMIHGVFSGDTIIHRDYWGSMEMYVVFARFFFDLAKKYDNFYWFLISKGYKTYRMLPVFFCDFYPSFHKSTPPLEQSIIDGYGELLYKDEYDRKTGVIQYTSVKDKLKTGVADITGKELRNPDIQFFLKANPAYHRGNDLVCLARLSEDNLQPRARKLLFGE